MLAARVCAEVVAGFVAWLILDENPAGAGAAFIAAPSSPGAAAGWPTSRRTWARVRAVAFTW
jgi:hypothetical protein